MNTGVHTACEVITMQEDKQPTSPKNLVNQKWFWPAVYSFIAILMIALLVGYNFLSESEEQTDTLQPVSLEPETAIETNVREETMKYPFDETVLNNVKILQEYYDVTADTAAQENALLVFNQTYQTSTGLSIAINSEPFQVLAALSGTVKEIKLDAFTGNTITLQHENGYETRYTSVDDIVVQEGDKVSQGAPLATTIDNEWNPTAGVHLYFEIYQEGQPISPRTLLAF